MKTEKGSMVWMDPCMTMETKGGGMKKMFSKAFSGESMFQNIYTAQSDGRIAFGSSFPGQILPIEIKPGQEFMAQKMAFLASEIGAELVVRIVIGEPPLYGARPLVESTAAGTSTHTQLKRKAA